MLTRFLLNARSSFSSCSCRSTRAPTGIHAARAAPKGRCTFQDGECVATSHADCAASRACDTAGKCFANPQRNRCDAGYDRPDRPSLIAGIVLTAAGGFGFMAGAAVAFGANLACPDPEARSEKCERTILTGLGVMGVGGVVMLAIGTPLLVAGSRKQYRDDVPAPALAIGPGTLRYSF